MQLKSSILDQAKKLDLVSWHPHSFRPMHRYRFSQWAQSDSDLDKSGVKIRTLISKYQYKKLNWIIHWLLLQFRRRKNQNNRQPGWDLGPEFERQLARRWKFHRHRKIGRKCTPSCLFSDWQRLLCHSWNQKLWVFVYSRGLWSRLWRQKLTVFQQILRQGLWLTHHTLSWMFSLLSVSMLLKHQRHPTALFSSPPS